MSKDTCMSAHALLWDPRPSRIASSIQAESLDEKFIVASGQLGSPSCFCEGGFLNEFQSTRQSGDVWWGSNRGKHVAARLVYKNMPPKGMLQTSLLRYSSQNRSQTHDLLKNCCELNRDKNASSRKDVQ